MHIWTVANQKGGVGKTTSAVALAGLLWARKKRVLLLDLDPQASLSIYLGCNPDGLEFSAWDWFDQRQSLSATLARRSLYSTAHEGLDLVPAILKLATLERSGGGGAGGLGLVVGQALNLLKDDYDYVVIDCPPQLGVLMVNALAASEQLIVPVQTEFLALQGLERMLRTLQMLSRSRHKALSHIIVPTLFDRRTQASVKSLRQLRHDYGDEVWPGRIPVDTKLRDASKAGELPHLFAPGSHAIEAYASLTGWLLGQRRGGDRASSDPFHSHSAGVDHG